MSNPNNYKKLTIGQHWKLLNLRLDRFCVKNYMYIKDDNHISFTYKARTYDHLS